MLYDQFASTQLIKNFLKVGSKKKRMETTHKLFDYVVFIIQSSLLNVDADPPALVGFKKAEGGAFLIFYFIISDMT
ncbi:MAG: hypothetical protein IPI77_19320 [Saprospiraceae bacterium]|nr:hypothetical protein [Saprospiraceae bacterium]